MMFIIVSISLMLIEKCECDKLSPCMTPHFCDNVPLDPFDVLTLLLILLYMLSMIFKNLLLMLRLISFPCKKFLKYVVKSFTKVYESQVHLDAIIHVTLIFVIRNEDNCFFKAIIDGIGFSFNLAQKHL